MDPVFDVAEAVSRKTIERRSFIKQVAAMTAASALDMKVRAADSAAHVVVKTSYGQIRGASQSGLSVFKGIPYAGPSDDKNRFKPPTKLQPWIGIRDAIEYGPRAMQNPDPNNPNAPIPPTSENCHFLNIWTPGFGTSAKRPVMFYLHGGGFLTGSGGVGQNLNQDGSALAKGQDVVVVAINHRLGAFGYLYLGDLAGEEYAVGNVGQLDIIAALEWVRENISQFGGDPGNVMIFGESGGARKVSVLMGMNKARGLFHKASIESCTGLLMTDREHASNTTRFLLSKLGLRPNQVKELLQIPAEKILQAQAEVGHGIPVSPMTQILPGYFGPVLDQNTLLSDPFDPVATPISANIPLLIGNNKDESAFYLQRAPDAKEIFNLPEEGLLARVRTLLGDNAFKAIEVYKKSRPKASPTELLIAINTAEWIWANTVKLAERKAMQPAPVFAYVFAYESEVPAVPELSYPIKSPHAGEIPFKFDHPENNPGTGSRPERVEVAHNMSRAWAAFARDGNPSHPNIPKWSPYNPTNRNTMFIDVDFRLVKDPYREERLFWNEISACGVRS